MDLVDVLFLQFVEVDLYFAIDCASRRVYRRRDVDGQRGRTSVGLE